MGIAVSKSTTATVTFSTPQEIVVSHLDDSIRIGDGTNLATITPIGSKKALDVNAVNAAAATTPTIANVSAPVAGTEYNYSLPAGTKSYRLNARGNAKVQLAVQAGASNTEYVTIFAGSEHRDQNLNTATTLYFRTNKDSEIIEILSWA